MKKSDLKFQALDGFELTGTAFESEEEPHSILLINSGTGIPRQFYRRYAQHAAERGFAAMTFDYRGIGGSAPKKLRGFKARYRDWGQQDIPGAIEFLTSKYPELPLYVLGHSTGGQQLGLAPNIDKVKASVFVTVSTGYWRGMPAPYKYMVLALMRAYVPVSTRIYGYAPSGKVGWGENLPTNVMREWVAWCKEYEYMAAYFDKDDPNGSGWRRSIDGKDFRKTYFDKITFPIRGYYFEDDSISTRANVPPMLKLFDKTEVEERWYKPSDLGKKKIDHLGFFRPKLGGDLWDESLDWLLATN